MKVLKYALKTFMLLTSTLKHDSLSITTSRLYVSTKLQNSNVYLQILLQLTCSKTSDLPSILHVDVMTGDYTQGSACVSLLTSFVFTASLSSSSHNNVTCSWISVCHVSSVVPSLQVPSTKHCHSFLPAGLLPLKPQVLE